MASRMIPLTLAAIDYGKSAWMAEDTMFVVPGEVRAVVPEKASDLSGDASAVFVGNMRHCVLGKAAAVRAQIERAMGFHGPLDVPPER